MLIVLNDNEMSISATVGAFSTYLSKIKLSGAWQSSKSRLRPRAAARSRSSGRRRVDVEPAAAPVGRQLRQPGPAVRGPRDHLHRRRARATTSTRCSQTLRPRARAQGPGDRPRADPEGPRLPARRDGPGRRSTAPPCRRWSSRPRRTRSTARRATPAHRAAPVATRPNPAAARPHGAGSNGDALAPPTPASAAEEAAELHVGLRRAS